MEDTRKLIEGDVRESLVCTQPLKESTLTAALTRSARVLTASTLAFQAGAF